MPVVTPAQRIRVYASPAVDPTQTTVLTPRAGALHSDPFQLATVAGITGYQPYLQQQTQGRRGRLDFKSKKVDIGAFTFTCHDPRIDESSGNDERWLSQFYGDETARSAMARLRVEYEESLDFDPADPNASTWRRLATLRIADVRQVRRLQFTLSTTDLADDLGSDCWIGDPHTSVSYAARAPLLPAGLLQPWGDFPADDFPGSPGGGLPGRTVVTTGQYPRRVHTSVDFGSQTTRQYNVLTERVRSLAINVTEIPIVGGFVLLDFASAPGTSPRIRVALYAGGGFQGWYWLTRAIAHFDDEEHWRMDDFYVVPAPELGGAVFPPDDTAVTWAWYETGPATEDSPILVGYVPAATLAADIIDGLFGELAVDGSPLHAVPRDGPSFANLAADPTIPLVWARISERAVRREWIAEHICKPLQLGLMVNESGQVTLLDLRRQQTVATDLPEITDADLLKDMAGETSAWVSGDAITQIAAATLRFSRHGTIVTSVLESRDRWPTVPAVMVDVSDTTLLFALIGNEELRALDFASKPESVDYSAFATGFSPQIATSAALTAKQAARQGAVGDMAGELFAMFGHGAHYITLPARRTGIAEDTRAGSRRLLTASSIVDPRTNLRGTSQIALCIERNEQGIGSTLVFVALGLNTAADPPSVGTPVLGTECETTIDWPITLNAAGDAVQVQVLQQPVGDPTPDAIDVRWTDVVMVTATGTVAIGPLLSGYDVYLRARSEPAGGGTLPSDWVYPTPAFLTTCSPASLSGCALSNVSESSATVSWDPGASEGQVYVLIDGVVAQVLEEGTTSVTLTGLVDGQTITVSSSPTGSPGCSVVFAAGADACVLPTWDEVVDQAAGSLELLFTDPQLRLLTVAFATQSGLGALSGYVVDATAPYSTTVALVEGRDSLIRYRVTFQDCNGDTVTSDGVVVFPGLQPEPPPIAGDADGHFFEIAFHGSLVDSVRSPAIGADWTALGKLGIRRVDLSRHSRCRIVDFVTNEPLPAGALAALEYAPREITNPVDADWNWLANEDENGIEQPQVAVDAETQVPLASDYLSIADGARQDVNIRIVVKGGDGTLWLGNWSLVAQFEGDLLTPPGTDDTPVTPPTSPCTRGGFNVADLAFNPADPDDLSSLTALGFALTDTAPATGSTRIGLLDPLNPTIPVIRIEIQVSSAPIIFAGAYTWLNNYAGPFASANTYYTQAEFRREVISVDVGSLSGYVLEGQSNVHSWTTEGESGYQTSTGQTIAGANTDKDLSFGYYFVDQGNQNHHEILYLKSLRIVEVGCDEDGAGPNPGGGGGGDPTPPPPPSSGLHSLILFNYNQQNWFDYSPFNAVVLTPKAYTQAAMLELLDACRAGGMKIVLNLVFRKDAKVNGKFSQSAYLACLNGYAGVDISGYTDVIIGILIIDEPHLATQSGWGMVIPQAVVDGVLAKRASELFPGYILFERAKATRLEASGRVFQYITGCWNQMSGSEMNRMTVAQYMRQEIASQGRIPTSSGIGLAKRMWGLANKGTGGTNQLSVAQYRSAIPMARDAGAEGLAVWADSNPPDLILRQSDYKAVEGELVAAMA